jgi:hypothetical protein
MFFLSKKANYRVCVILICTCIVSIRLNAQQQVTTAANTSYDKAGKVKRLIFGEHYRKEWATPVTFPVLNLDSVAGGLTPIKAGGGMQTKSLRLQGADGKEYVLRSVNKDPTKALPPEFAGTFADEVLQDQISSSNPYAPLVVSSLADAAGILHTTPVMVMVPKSPRLGEFSKDFENTLCLFEERPSDNSKGTIFGNANAIENTEKLFQKLLINQTDRVDERAFLKARLFDIWIGDWDRHQDQWLWAGYVSNGATLYKPIPRDRDQAFSKLDGLVPQIAARKWAIRKTQNFDYTIRDVNGMNMTAGPLDRNFTRQLTYSEWIDISNDLKKLLSDEVIENAFKKMPEQIFKISADKLIRKLKKRRDDLDKYATTYYRFLAKEPDILGTLRKETFNVTSIGKDSAKVIVYDNDNNVLFNKAYRHPETKELRLYGMGSDDVFNVDDQVKKDFRVRVIPGSDKKHAYNPRAMRYDWLAPVLSPGYNPDDGLYLGGGVIFKKQQFGKTPYGQLHSVWANYAFSTSAYNFGYHGQFKQLLGPWDLLLDARLNAPFYTRNFYGFGNETEKTGDNNYYRVRSNEVIVSPAISRQFGTRNTLTTGIEGWSVDVERSEDRFVVDSKSGLDSSIFNRKNYGSAFVQHQFSTLDNMVYPRKGIKMISTVKYIKNLKDSKGFMNVSYNTSVYFSKGVFTAAIRPGVAFNIGDDFEFFQANTLGATKNLRGFRRDRFAGKTSLYNNAELRFRFRNSNGYFLRGDFGFITFLDNGRVWMPGESSDKWHSGYGTGIFFIPYNMVALTATYGMSKEENIVSVKAGFQF